MDPVRIFVANLSAWPDAGVVIAAIRAGAFGALNLEGVSDLREGAALIERVNRFVKRPFAVKVDGGDPSRALPLLASLPESVDRVFVSRARSESLPELIAAAGARPVWVEVTSARDARALADMGVKGLLAKGHESGGEIGEEGAFILLQRLAEQCSLPVIVAGGVGRHSIAALAAGGAEGVWLDSQVALTPESTLPEAVKMAVAASQGDEAICLGRSIGAHYRVFKRPGMAAISRIEQELRDLEAEHASPEKVAAWRAGLLERVSWDGEEPLWPLGQDCCIAAELTRDFVNVAGIVRGLSDACAAHVATAREVKPWQEGSPLAADHGSRFPVLQGPMTRVSDCAPFAYEVASGGGLPFLALALLRAPQCRATLEESKRLLGDLPWGVGILGFVPPELRAEQLAVIRDIRPPFALIAGGRPDQAAELEADGITTYLHAPSRSLLETFVDQGARRFVFEGSECGGHIGPRTSFVLWEQAVAALLQKIEEGVKPEELHVVFAGGIHDARSAAMVAALAAPLYAQGVRLGLLMGTAYLFTKEAVASGAIVEGFQQRALECADTVVLESGAGHLTRCAPTQFAADFQEEKRRLLKAGLALREIRDRLEDLNVGRLRIASKGIERAGQDKALVDVTPERQSRDGMYMIGQVAALRGEVGSIVELHESVCLGSSAYLEKTAPPKPFRRAKRAPEPPCDVAIVGMSCLLPGARNRVELWNNIIAKRDMVEEVPGDRFNIDLYYDRDKNARDKVYSRWGGFLSPVAFDPMRYGIPPASLTSIDPMQLLSLLIVDQALADAGYANRDFERERTSVIFGMSGGLGDLGIKYAVRSSLPQYLADTPEEVLRQLPEWTEDSFAGILMNVTSGRIANRFDFGGVNFTVDAACASSLAALYLGARELNHGGSDVVVVGGSDTVQSPFGYMCFSTSKALSPKGRCRTFDSEADGIAISEGVGAVILRRLEDAERDGDRIYAVVKGVQGSSDGRGRGLTAPLPKGQMRVLRRAYEQAGFSPASVGLIEAHGTGTVAGDAAELESLSTVFREGGAKPGSCAVGSIKSMVGHTKSTAGVAGMMKVALSLYNGVRPPTLNVEKPNPQLRAADSPFHLTLDAQPWAGAGPKRAGVSSFGFGGANFHAVLEEYAGDFRPAADRPPTAAWPAELFFWRADAREKLRTSVEAFGKGVSTEQPLAALAAQSWTRAVSGDQRAAIVATSHEDLTAKLRALAAWLENASGDLPAGCFFGAGDAGKLALLFSGQGSQRPFMLRELALRFPEMRETLDSANQALDGRFEKPLSDIIYPPHPFTKEEADAQAKAITDTSVAQPALGAVETGLLRTLARLGVTPDMTAGHSYGEYVALHAAGVFSAADLFRLSAERGGSIKTSVGENPGTMAAVQATIEQVRVIAEQTPHVVVANHNAPEQTVLAGPESAVDAAIEACKQAGLAARRLPVACAFHSPLMQQATDRFSAALDSTTLAAPALPVYSNTSAEPHPADTGAIVASLAAHLTSPVRWVEQIERMYADGARVFLEVGPGKVLARLTSKILAGREDITVVASEERSADATACFLEALAQLAVHGRLPRGAELFRGRLADLAQDVPQGSWRLTGSGAYPQGKTQEAARPVRLAPPAPAPIAPAATAAPAVAQQPAASAALPADDEIDRIMTEHNRLMQSFLETQQQLMSAFLGAPAPAAAAPSPQPQALPAPAPIPRAVAPEPPPAPVSAPAPQPEPVVGGPSALETLLAITSERTGYPVDLLDPAAALEADLGVDSIKRVEIIGAFQKTCSDDVRAKISDAMDDLTSAPSLQDLAAALENLAPAAAPAPVTQPAGPNALEALLAITSERTGYPVDLLDPTAALEADLGVDSIKRVEIIGAFQKTCSDDVRAKISDAMDDLTSAPSLQDLAAALENLAPAAAPRPSAIAEPSESPDVLATLLAITSERTGYPIDLLDPTAALEADLGVDSIKRVEIIGAFQKTCPAEVKSAISDAMDDLTSAPSLQDLAAALEKLAPTAAPHPAVTAEEPESPDVLATLLAITSERTGYPVDLLDPAAALEADLGVDSIKRVEIIGAFQKTCPAEVKSAISEAMDSLSAAASLAELAQLIESTLRPTPAEAPSKAPARLLLTVQERPRRSDPRFQPERVTLLATDGSPLAAEAAERLRQAGESPVLLYHTGGQVPAGATAADLTDEASLSEALAAIRSSLGAIENAVHLFEDHGEAHVAKSGYLLAKHVLDDLAASDGTFTVVTRRGGRFALNGDSGACPPASVSLADFTKCLAAEAAGFRCKVLDVEPRVSAEALVAELTCADDDLEVGLTSGARWTVAPRLEDNALTRHPALPADPVFLITGGARGVTSAIARLAARTAGARIVLVGSTPLGDAETQETAGLEDAALKQALLQQLRASGAPARPVDLEAAYRKVTRRREIAHTVAELASLGAQVDYEAVDVRDVAAFGALIDRTYDRFGRIDVVVHGAGVIEDKLIRDKTPESFDRVFGTKAISTHVLATKLRPESLRALVFMSSISAAFGNRGQADYAAANGFMNGMALQLSERWGPRVTAINWGPWDQKGMVSDGVRKQFEERGIGLIPLDKGAEQVFAEIALERLEPIVVIGDGPWCADAVSTGMAASNRGGA